MHDRVIAAELSKVTVERKELFLSLLVLESPGVQTVVGQ